MATAVQSRPRTRWTFQEAEALGRLLVVGEAAPLLGVSEQRLLDLARRKLVPHVRLGRSVKFSVEALRKWVESGGKALPGGWRRKAED